MELDTCVFCGETATLLCDFPAGGNISSMLIHYKDGRVEVVDDTVLRCSRPICEKCATNIGGMDVCPKCLERLIDEHERLKMRLAKVSKHIRVAKKPRVVGFCRRLKDD
jgi:hypothetical protein